MAYTLIETVTVGSGGASSIEFTGIAAEAGADLELVISARSVSGTAIRGINLYFNNDTAANYTRSRIVGEGANPVIGTGPHTDSVLEMGWMSAAGTTTSTFGNAKIHISNYASSSAKVATSFAASENAATDANLSMHAHTWSGTAAISSILMTTSGDIAEHSTASLYLVTTTDATGGTGGGGNFVQKATGGTIVGPVGGYFYHTFTGSGTFTPTVVALNVECLVVAGGSGGGGDFGGGGGAGGLINQSLSLTSTGYSVTIGAGGSGGSTTGSSGSGTTFSTLSALGGGRAGGGDFSGTVNGGFGGSGGGAGGLKVDKNNSNPLPTGGAGTAGQGFAGANSGWNSGNYLNSIGGGGGGGSAASTGRNGGAGGNYSDWASATSTGESSSYAGGGGGGGYYSSGSGGSGGGTNGATQSSSPSSSPANTGGGAGGSGQATGGTGGSGIVIVRYLG